MFWNDFQLVSWSFFNDVECNFLCQDGNMKKDFELSSRLAVMRGAHKGQYQPQYQNTPLSKGIGVF